MLGRAQSANVSVALSPVLAGVVLVVVLVAGAVNGVAGFGFALVGTMALATVVEPTTAVVFMILPILSVNLSLVRDLLLPELRTCGRRFAPLMGAALVGTVVGLVTLDVVPAAPLRVGLGAVSLPFVVNAQEAVTVRPRAGPGGLFRRVDTRNGRRRRRLGAALRRHQRRRPAHRLRPEL